VWAAEQLKFKEQLVTCDLFTWVYNNGSDDVRIGSGEIEEEIKYVGGVDISFIKDNDKDACACFTVLSFPDLDVVYQQIEMVELTEPYIPSFLAFRECPPLVTVIQKALAHPDCPRPQVIMVDGNGELHTRGYGSACHFGVLLDMPTIGIGKEYFMIGDIEETQKTAKQQAKKHNKKKGDWLPLVGKSGKLWAAALQGSDASSNPIYVSVGHKLSLPTAVELVTVCCKHRIPEPVRRADLDSRDYLKNLGY